jgi:phosphoserine phosphatase
MNQKKCRFYCYRNTRDLTRIDNGKLDKIELVVFDMDGVLADTISSWKYIHDYFNTSNEKSVDEYLKGKIDDMEFVRRDASLWKENGKPITRDKLVEILSDIPLMEGAEHCIAVLKDYNIKTAIVSAGLDILAERVSDELGIDHFLANGVKTDNENRLNGKGIIGVRLMYKDEAVINLSEKLGIPFKRIASVGNSCFDIPMFTVSGLSIAFNPEDDCVREAADYVVEGRDLGNILSCIKEYI